MVGSAGLEPAAAGFGDQRPQSRGEPIPLVDAKGIEPPPSGCKPDVLPLSLRARTVRRVDSVAARHTLAIVTDPTTNWSTARESNPPQHATRVAFTALAKSRHVCHPHCGSTRAAQRLLAIWSDRRESNPCLRTGNPRRNHYATTANWCSLTDSNCPSRVRSPAPSSRGGSDVWSVRPESNRRHRVGSPRRNLYTTHAQLAPMAGVEPAGRGFGDRTITTDSPALIRSGVTDGT